MELATSYVKTRLNGCLIELVAEDGQPIFVDITHLDCGGRVRVPLEELHELIGGLGFIQSLRAPTTLSED